MNKQLKLLFGKCMKNVTIEKTYSSYCVSADTKKFGEHVIMYEGTLEECKRYIKSHGIKLSNCKNYNSFSHGYIKKWIA